MGILLTTFVGYIEEKGKIASYLITAQCHLISLVNVKSV
jgi:hypothetical protein